MIKKEKYGVLTGADNIMQKQKTWTLAAWVVIFFAGLLFIPTAIFTSITYFPDAPILRHTLPSSVYFSGFFLSTVSFLRIAGKEKNIGIFAIVCGAIMMVVSLMVASPFLTIGLAGVGIFTGGISSVAIASINASREGKQERLRQPPQPPTRRFCKALKGLACVAIVLLASNSIPGIHRFAMATTSSIPANSTNPITVSGMTIEVISPSKFNLYVNQTVIMLEFNGSFLICNGTAIRLQSSRLQLSEPNTKGAISATGTSTIFLWDRLQFVSGQYIKYPHPDRDHYRNSPYTSWSQFGNLLLHYQTDQRTSAALIQYGAPAAVAAICTIIGTLIGSTVVGLVVGVVLAIYIGYTGEDMLDECGCVWWWTSISFITWLLQNQGLIATYYLINPASAIALVLAFFMMQGYLMVGNTLFYDAVGAGRPIPPSDPVPIQEGGSHIHRTPGGSRTCIAR
jgi:hypothetical protein